MPPLIKRHHSYRLRYPHIVHIVHIIYVVPILQQESWQHNTASERLIFEGNTTNLKEISDPISISSTADQS
jgi:hypothetical protein